MCNLVCQSEEITLRLLEKLKYHYKLPNLIISIIYLFPKFFVLYTNTTKTKNWIVGRKVTKGLKAIIHTYIQYIYIQGVPGGMDEASGECSLC
jgi:hypothetical protein